MAESRCIRRILDFSASRPRRQTAVLRPPRRLIRLDPSDPSTYERLLNNFPKRQDKKIPFATFAVAFVDAIVRARQYLMKVEGYQLSRW
eukprot:5817255-Pleurochrysis_carterae.AAC.1